MMFCEATFVATNGKQVTTYHTGESTAKAYMRQQLDKKSLRGDKRVTLSVVKIAAGKPALLEWLNKREETVAAREEKMVELLAAIAKLPMLVDEQVV